MNQVLKDLKTVVLWLREICCVNLTNSKLQLSFNKYLRRKEAVTLSCKPLPPLQIDLETLLVQQLEMISSMTIEGNQLSV
jgi:hypothetical protein